ncbi:MAG: DUF2220 family protein [Thermodesulfobacteriota bacterium]|nr:DUF2220 family protein [Thermodesulfobacteriota bacterium]
MITTAQIKSKALKFWNNGSILSAFLRGDSIFPVEIAFRKVTAKQALENYTQVRNWMNSLRAASKEQQGYGYGIEFSTSNHRQLGEQQFPARIYFATQDDLLRFIGKQRDFNRFTALARQILIAQPSLGGWLKKHPLKVLEHRCIWDELLRVCRFFQHNLRPNHYLRELQIADVDTKFIGQHKGVLRELLDQILPDEAINYQITTLSGSGFERRYGLRYDEPLIRLRMLDSKLAKPWGITDISVPLSQFRVLTIPCKRVFITENKINGLAFPQVDDAIVIFGLGYGIQALSEVAWLHEKELHYWGDIDTHGFAILSQLRSYFPHTQSILMDRATLLAHQQFWVAEESGKRCLAQLPHLTTAELELYRELSDNSLGDNIRLEQERICFSVLYEVLKVC